MFRIKEKKNGRQGNQNHIHVYILFWPYFSTKNYFVDSLKFSQNYFDSEEQFMRRNGGKYFYFIVSGEISVYLVKIKVISITRLISYHYTCDWYDLYFHSSLWTT